MIVAGTSGWISPDRPPTGVQLVGLIALYLGGTAVLTSIVGLIAGRSTAPEPTCPPTLSGRDRIQWSRIRSGYERVQQALQFMPSGRERNRIVAALAGFRPADVALEIVTSPAWSAPWLADHRLTWDPLHEASEIYDSLARVAERTTELGYAAAVYPESDWAHRYSSSNVDTAADLQAIEERARAFRGYGANVAQLSSVLLIEDRYLRQCGAGAGHTMVADRGQHHRATRQLWERGREVQLAAAGLRSLQSLVNGAAAPPGEGSDSTGRNIR